MKTILIYCNFQLQLFLINEFSNYTTCNYNVVSLIKTFNCTSGSFLGSLSSVPAHELGAVCIKEALSRGSVPPDDVSEVILGQVYTAGIYINGL